MVWPSPQYTYSPSNQNHSSFFKFILLQLSSQKNFLGRKNIGGAFAPSAPPPPKLRLWLKAYILFISTSCRSQWPRGLKRSSAAARLLRLWVRIPPGAWMFVCCECCVLSGRGLCDELITRPEESYRLWCVVVCDLETSWMRKPWPTGSCCAKRKRQLIVIQCLFKLC